MGTAKEQLPSSGTSECMTSYFPASHICVHAKEAHFPMVHHTPSGFLDFQRRLSGKGGLLQTSQLGGWDTGAKAS